jgi:hypothetical protein
MFVDLVGEFLERPSAGSFTALRTALLADLSYRFHSADDAELSRLIEAGDNSSAVAMLPGLLPNWMLSPGVHQMLSEAAEMIGDDAVAQSEQYFARAALSGLLQSGSGTEESPYLVTHVSDEFEVVSALEKDAGIQRQVRTESGVFDVITCRDGTELWFDVTPGFLSPA